MSLVRPMARGMVRPMARAMVRAATIEPPAVSIAAPTSVTWVTDTNPPLFTMLVQEVAPDEVQVGDIPQIRYNGAGTVYSGAAVTGFPLSLDFSGAGLPTLGLGAGYGQVRFVRDPGGGGEVIGDWSSASEGAFTIATAYEAESEAIFAAFTTPPDDTRKGHIDACVAALKAASVWTKLDGLAFAAAADGGAGSINWKSPGTYDLTPVNSPTFTADEGYAGNGSNAYLSTGFVPSIAGGQMTQNSAHIGVYCRTNRTADENKYLMGCSNAAYNRLLLIGPKQSVPVNDFAANGGVFNPSGYTTTLGHHIVSRTAASGSGAIKGYLNGNTTPVWSENQTSVGLPDVAIRILASCQDTSIVRPTTDQVAAAHWGAGLDATEQAALASAINTYLTALSANVY